MKKRNPYRVSIIECIMQALIKEFCVNRSWLKFIFLF